MPLPEPKTDPLPEPKSDRGMVRCLVAEGRCSVGSIWTQGDEDGSLVGVWSSSSSSSVAKRWPFMTAWQSKECWSHGSRRRQLIVGRWGVSSTAEGAMVLSTLGEHLVRVDKHANRKAIRKKGRLVNRV